MSEVDSQPNRMVRYLATAGTIGPLLYTGTWLFLGFLNPAYSHVRDPISDLSAIGAPYAPVLTFIIIVSAILTVAFAFGFHLGFPQASGRFRRHWSSWGSAPGSAGGAKGSSG